MLYSLWNSPSSTTLSRAAEILWQNLIQIIFTRKRREALREMAAEVYERWSVIFVDTEVLAKHLWKLLIDGKESTWFIAQTEKLF